MKLDFTIREKLVIFYVALVFLAVCILGYYSFNSARNAIVNRSFEQLTAVRELKKNRLFHFINDRIQEIKLISKSPNLQRIINNNSIDSLNIEIDYHIKEFLEGRNYYSDLFLISNTTSKIYPINHEAQNNIDITDSLRTMICNTVHMSNKTEVFDCSDSKRGFQLLIASPISTKQNNCIVLVFSISLSAINEIMLEQNSFGGFGESGESYLVGKDYKMRSSSRFNTKSVLHTIVNTNAVKQGFTNTTGTEIIKDYRGVEVLSSFTKYSFSNIDWVLLAEIDLNEIMVPVFTIRNQIILMGSVIILLLTIFAFFISRHITNPLIYLRDIALEIAKGHYGKTIQITSNDEVGELTEAFNHMSVQILEQTKELREREKRLQHFYQATTDGIILHNRGKIILVNQAITNLTYYKNDELLGTEVSVLFQNLEFDRIKKHPEKNYIYETECIRKDSSKFPIEVIENPIEYEGNVIGAIVIRNISERIDAQHKLDEERNKRVTSFIDGQEDERKRLSRELHDGLGQSLVAIKMRLELLKLNSEQKNIDSLEIIKNFVNQTIQDVRRISNNLIPSVLRDIGLKLAIQKLCKETEENTGLQISFDADSVTKIPDERVKSYLYRITQEAIHNAVKHAKATEMSIMLIQEPTKVRLIIEDNGIGFDKNNLDKRGKGLYSFQERVAILHGQLTISSSPGKGVYIDVRIPLT